MSVDPQPILITFFPCPVPQSSFNDPAYLDGGESVVAVAYPWEMSFEPSTGVFSTPLHIPVPTTDQTYYCVLYTKCVHAAGPRHVD